MKKTLLKYLPLGFAAFAAVTFTGCPVTFTVSASPDSTLYYNFNTTAGKSTKELISAFDNSIDKSNSDSTVIFDTVEIERALLKMGLKNVSALTQKIDKNNQKLSISASSSENKFNFIKIIRNKSGEATQMQLTLSPAILQDLITNQNNIIQKYADLLMAPCFTNEAIEKDEYIELLASLYGNDVAKEFTDGQIEIKLKNSDRKKIPQSFSIPIIDILLLTEEKTFIINY